MCNEKYKFSKKYTSGLRRDIEYCLYVNQNLATRLCYGSETTGVKEN